MYALIEFAGKQYQVEEGSSIKVPRVQGKVGTKVTFDKILYIDNGKNKTIGFPLVEGAKVDGEIESHGRERKVVVFKFKRRKGYQKKNTHRQDYTIIKVGKLGKIKKSGAVKKTTTPETKKNVDNKEKKKKVSQKNSALKTTKQQTPEKKYPETKKEKG